MASSASLCCPIRQVVVLVYPGTRKAASEPRITLHSGRRARPGQKPRLMPLRTALTVAPQLQACHIGTVSGLLRPGLAGAPQGAPAISRRSSSFRQAGGTTPDLTQ